MRIIDKSTDFYDYLQNVYRDNSVTFDRTDSFLVTKEMMCDALYSVARRNGEFVLLQVCNTFWLFFFDVTATSDEYGTGFERPTAYSIEPLASWKNYDKGRKLLKLDVISFSWKIISMLRSGVVKPLGMHILDKHLIKKHLDTLKLAIDTNDYEVEESLNNHAVYKGYRSNQERTEKHIPLLKACGIANYIDPLEIYLAINEFFSLEKQEQERTESVGITDKEKVVNHGFDVKKSFRGKSRR